MLGCTVKVTIDRPLGSAHPRFPDLVYPINYGYVEGTIAPDGEAQDAYVLGVDKPIDTFCGQVIAVICRLDDIEDKWVVAPPGISFSEEEIRAATHFQEQFFSISISLFCPQT